MLFQFHSVVQEIASPISKQQTCDSILYIYVGIRDKTKGSMKEKRGTGCGLGEMDD